MRCRLAVAVLAVIAGSCTSSLTAPTSARLVLSISKSDLAVNGTAIVTATVREIESGAPINGALVRFSSSLGTFAPLEALTENGTARTTFTATANGYGTIAALSGPVAAEPLAVRIGELAAPQPVPEPERPGLPTLSLVCDNSGGVNVPIVCRISTSNASTIAINWGDRSPEESLSPAAASASHVYGTAARYTISARATNAAGQTSASADVSIGSTLRAPTLVTTGGIAVGLPTTFVIDMPQSAAPVASVTIDFGDGEVRHLGAVAPLSGVTKTYAAAGSYTITLSAVDTVGQRSSSTSVITVVVGQPTIDVTYTGTLVGGVSKTLTVTALPQTGFSGPAIVLNTVTVDGVSVYSAGGNGTFSRTLAVGAHTIVATTKDAVGTTVTKTISVSAVRGQPTVDVTYDGDIVAGTPETFTVTGAPQSGFGGPSIVSNTVTIDGVTVYTGPNGTFSHTFASGTFTMVATTTDAIGTTGTKTITLTVP